MSVYKKIGFILLSAIIITTQGTAIGVPSSLDYLKRGLQSCSGKCDRKNIICQGGVNKQGYIEWCENNCLNDNKSNRGEFEEAITSCLTSKPFNFSAEISGLAGKKGYKLTVISSKLPDQLAENSTICLKDESLRKALQKTALIKGTIVHFNRFESNGYKGSLPECKGDNLILGNAVVGRYPAKTTLSSSH